MRISSHPTPCCRRSQVHEPVAARRSGPPVRARRGSGPRESALAVPNSSHYPSGTASACTPPPHLPRRTDVLSCRSGALHGIAGCFSLSLAVTAAHRSAGMSQMGATASVRSVASCPCVRALVVASFSLELASAASESGMRASVLMRMLRARNHLWSHVHASSQPLVPRGHHSRRLRRRPHINRAAQSSKRHLLPSFRGCGVLCTARAGKP